MPPNQKPAAKRSKKPVSQGNDEHKMSYELAGIIYIALGILFGVFLFGNYDAAFATFIKEFLGGLFGWCATLISLTLVGAGVYLFSRRNYGRLYFKLLLVGLAILNLSIISSLIKDPDGAFAIFDAFGEGAKYSGGGFFGALIAKPLTALLSFWPSIIIFFTTLILLVMFIFKISFIRLISGFTSKVKEEYMDFDNERSYEMGKRAREALDERVAARRNKKQIDFEVGDYANRQEDQNTSSQGNTQVKIPNFQQSADIPVFDAISTRLQESVLDEVIPPQGDDTDLTDEFIDGVIAPVHDPKKERLTPQQDAALRTQLDEGIKKLPIPYKFPSTTLLLPAKNKKGNDSRDELRETARKLVDTLKSFGVEVKLLQVSRGPTVTRYELQPNVGVKVSKITSLADDIALNLAAPSVRIEAPIPGKAAIGIEIPNQDISSVSLRDVLESSEFKDAESKLSVGMGMDITGKCVVANIAKMPHVLIAGATGSGKSVCINSLIISILYKANPNEVKFVMIDPKRVELLPYNGIPHLLIPVVTDPKKASGALGWAVAEMVRRYDLFAENGVRDLEGYNACAELQGEDKLPQIVIIIDELADLMMVAPKEVEDSICRLAQLARACGMHLVIATQRPSVNVITGIIKANIPSRIAFAVSSQIDSRTILDGAGAEKLLGRGDMLYVPMGASKSLRLQGSFISEGEVEKVVNFIKDTSITSYNDDISDKINGTGEVADVGDADELLPRAIELALTQGQISTSMLQRRMGIGYARAGRIVDQMEARGIISGADGSKPRNVLVSAEDIGIDI